jgi:triphosphoribosyl-dephospho-CoA synthetase
VRCLLLLLLLLHYCVHVQVGPSMRLGVWDVPAREQERERAKFEEAAERWRAGRQSGGGRIRSEKNNEKSQDESNDELRERGMNSDTNEEMERRWRGMSDLVE